MDFIYFHTQLNFAFNLCVELVLSKFRTKPTPEKRHKKKSAHNHKKCDWKTKEREKCREAFISLIPIWQKRIKKKQKHAHRRLHLLLNIAMRWSEIRCPFFCNNPLLLSTQTKRERGLTIFDPCENVLITGFNIIFFYFHFISISTENTSIATSKSVSCTENQ